MSINLIKNRQYKIEKATQVKYQYKSGGRHFVRIEEKNGVIFSRVEMSQDKFDKFFTPTLRKHMPEFDHKNIAELEMRLSRAAK